MIAAALRRCLLILWVLPGTLVGLTFGLLALATGGGCRRRSIILEFWGGAVTWMLKHCTPLPGGVSGMTLGHVVIGRSPEALDFCREHELVHVRQYERWGPFFIPVYLLLSVIIYFRGGHAYFDNPFEREAYEEAP
ncbi:hypothetical protein Pan216_44470 [Planctomycetes bacterium Pan216]|uniref:Uncharacterized protein n=1 Tax=Kolteria novifilia TaxID=2527975 RepID=A0A518B9A8_9BACT|nr:hypothetical protein Pan216_44470 [Planctomycetes bacterium Pan216]